MAIKPKIKPKPKPKKSAASIGVIINLIRAKSKARGLTAAGLSREAGIPYSRAWELLNGGGNRKLVNIEKALTILAPEIVDHMAAAAWVLEK